MTPARDCTRVSRCETIIPTDLSSKICKARKRARNMDASAMRQANLGCEGVEALQRGFRVRWVRQFDPQIFQRFYGVRKTEFGTQMLWRLLGSYNQMMITSQRFCKCHRGTHRCFTITVAFHAASQVMFHNDETRISLAEFSHKIVNNQPNQINAIVVIDWGNKKKSTITIYS